MRNGRLGQLFKDDACGFIRTESGEHLFFRADALIGVKFSSLITGQEVEFELGKGWRGKARAINVRILQPKSK